MSELLSVLCPTCHGHDMSCSICRGIGRLVRSAYSSAYAVDAPTEQELRISVLEAELRRARDHIAGPLHASAQVRAVVTHRINVVLGYSQ